VSARLRRSLIEERRILPELAGEAAQHGDPLGDPSVLLDRSRIWLVVQAGRAVAGEALARRSPFP